MSARVVLVKYHYYPEAGKFRTVVISHHYKDIIQRALRIV